MKLLEIKKLFEIKKSMEVKKLLVMLEDKKLEKLANLLTLQNHQLSMPEIC